MKCVGTNCSWQYHLLIEAVIVIFNIYPTVRYFHLDTRCSLYYSEHTPEVNSKVIQIWKVLKKKNGQNQNNSIFFSSQIRKRQVKKKKISIQEPKSSMKNETGIKFNPSKIATRCICSHPSLNAFMRWETFQSSIPELKFFKKNVILRIHMKTRNVVYVSRITIVMK